jgi:hypothetical protein
VLTVVDEHKSWFLDLEAGIFKVQRGLIVELCDHLRSAHFHERVVVPSSLTRNDSGGTMQFPLMILHRLPGI